MSEEKRLRTIFRYYPKDIDNLKLQSMNVCYCRFCGEFVMILRIPVCLRFIIAYALESFPIRKRDYSRVIEEDSTDFKYNLVYGGDTYVRREALLEKQCRFYCTHCKLLIGYRQSPPGEPSKFFYLVKDSITTDPDIMLREVRNYRLTIPPYIQRDPEDPSGSSIVLLVVEHGKEMNCIAGASDKGLLVYQKRRVVKMFSHLDEYEDEGKSNSYLIQFFSSLFHISSLDLSLMHFQKQLAIRIEGIDYEDMYVKIKEFVN